MGAKASPYQSIRAMLYAEDFITGDRHSASNPFRWSHVRLNLPGSRDYDPIIPSVAKIRSDNSLATDFYIYVDDVRITGGSEEAVREAIRRLSSILTYLGIHDAPRKRRPPTPRPGAWASSMVCLGEGCVGVCVNQKNWDKTNTHIE